MKKVAILMLAAGMVMATCVNSNAINFKIKGSFQFAFDYINGGSFMGKTRAGNNVIGQQWAAMHQGRDSFEAIQRLHLQMEAVASESLSGTVFFEIGEQRWGMASQGGALGADGDMVKVKQAYIDWLVPGTELKLRMGLQGVRLPGFALDNPVFNDDVAGITASYTFNKNVGLTALWLRPYNDNYVDSYGSSSQSNFMDNMDLFVLSLPVRGDGFKVTPWVMGGAMGPHTGRVDKNGGHSFYNPSSGGQALDGLSIRDGLAPAAFSSSRGKQGIWPDEYASMFWGGITGQMDLFSPFRLTADFIYGAVDYGRSELNRHGWFGMLLAEYELDWATPGIYGWYFSGDDDNPHNGSERLPYIATTNNLTNSLSTFGYRGNPIMGGGKGVLGVNPNGTWGVGFRLKDMSFLEDLKHTFRVNFFGGTNDTKMAAYITGRDGLDDGGRAIYRNNTDFNSFGTYLTTADTGIEINFDSTYQMYDNLKFICELGYIHLWLDKDVWGEAGGYEGNSLNYKDAWKASLNVIYSF